MGHGKETPRQKMIGMMYLVLMALLALNVSKEVLDAFGVLDKGLRSTISTVEAANGKIITDFQSQYELNPTKVGPWQKQAEKVRLMADSIVNFIQNKKLEMVSKSEGKNCEAIEEGQVDVKLIEAKDKTDIPAEIMVGDNNDKAGKRLHEMIDVYRNFLLNEVVTTQDAEANKNSIMNSLSTEVKPPKGHKSTELHNWESEHFEHLPIAGVISIMSGLQIDVRNAESEALRYLYRQIDAGSFKFNRLEATVIPNTNYVIKGNDYNAQVFLAASDTTASPTVWVVESNSPYDSTKDENGAIVYMKKTGLKYDSLPIQPGTGKGIFKRLGSSIGPRYWGGIIELTGSDGNKIIRPFKQSYMVAEGSVVVFPTKMNVFYLGVDNPVDVAVPGVQPDKINIDVTNGKYIKQGSSYIIRPSRPGNSFVIVYAQIDNSKREMGRREFRVKTVPDPVAKVNGQKGGAIAKNILLAQIGVAAEMENFDFDLTFTITEFTVSAVVQGFVKEYKSNSNKFTPEQLSIIKSMNRGQNVYIQDVKAVGPDGSTRPLSTINFKLN
jgi:gliding motility-associated protein GldM